MLPNRKVIRVFLASPGDLREERLAARRAVDELNLTWLPQNGYHVELVGWELTVAAVGRPQALINNDLDGCVYFIGAVWKRWGSRPANDDVYESGFEEEFERSLDRYRSMGTPEISLYFKAVDPQDSIDPGPQLQKVIEFKNRIISEHTLLYEEFSDAIDFEAKVRRGIFAYVSSLIEKETAEQEEEIQHSGPETSLIPLPVEAPAETPHPSLGQGAKFLKTFADRVASGEQNLDATDISRYRLIGTILSVDSDDPLLPVHDANRLFIAAEKIDFGIPEIRQLLASGLASYSNENTPVWRWIRENGDQVTLQWSSIGGRSDAIRVGSLEAMRDLGFTIVHDEFIPRNSITKQWLKEDVAIPNRLAALRYLADQGIPQDLEHISQELERKHYQTASVAAEAILRIALRESRSHALTLLLDLQLETIESSLITAIFDPPTGLLAEDIHRALLHRTASVRAAALGILSAQNSLTDNEINNLLLDSNVNVRLETMKHLSLRGTTFTKEEVNKNLLIKGKGVNFLGSETVDENRVPDFDRWLLNRESDDTLIKVDELFSIDADLIMYERRFSRQKNSLRQNLTNRFEKKWAHDLKVMSEAVGQSGYLLAQMGKSETITRRSWIRSGLDILCRKGGSEDLTLVRLLMDDGDLDYSTDEVEFIRLHGEWEDLTRLIAALERPSKGAPASSIFGLYAQGIIEKRYAETSRAMIKLGRLRIAEMLALPMPEGLRRQLLINLPHNSLTQLTDIDFLGLFSNDNSGVRKVAALRAVRSLSQKRLLTLFERHQKEDTRFYNVGVWLDLGISMPLTQARQTAERVLRRI